MAKLQEEILFNTSFEHTISTLVILERPAGKAGAIESYHEILSRSLPLQDDMKKRT